MSVELSVSDLTVRFGGLRAVAELSLRVLSGEILGLIGPNGAGKSTVINAITGFVATEAGEISLRDEGAIVDVLALPTHRRSARGIVRTFQTPRLIPELNVAQNVAMGSIEADIRQRWFEALGGPGLQRGTRARHRAALDALDSLSLAQLATSDPSELSLGEQRLVEIARAMVSGARVVLLDEPFAGLSAVEQERLAIEIDRLRSSDVALLLVEHNLEHVRALADKVVAMDQGAEFLRGTATEVLDSREVRERYLGEVHA